MGLPVGVMLRSMTSVEMTYWQAYHILLAEDSKPKPQSPKQVRHVLDSLAKQKPKGGKRR